MVVAQTCGSPALRVVQLDSYVLDKEIETYLETQLNELISYLPISVTIVFQRYVAEVRVILFGVLWFYRIFRGFSPGQEMMEIAYRHYPRKIVISHFLAVIILPYILEKLSDKIEDPEKKAFIQKLIHFGRFLEFLHHLYFLNKGGFSTIWERILHLKAEYVNPPTLGIINYTSLNRELLWHSYRDLLLLALPLGQTVRQLWTRWRTRRALKTSAATKTKDFLKQNMKPFSPILCSRCDKPAVIPVQNQNANILEQCGHIFCLYCYDSRIECPKCGLSLIKGKEIRLRGFAFHVE
jgi:predicted nucleic-acid-binding Zn-ribbon protein